MSILEVRNLSLTLGNKLILDQVSLGFSEGKIHAVVGPNGAGKSTLAATIMGLNDYQNFTGEIFFQQKKLKGKSINERANFGITLAWQEPARFEGLLVKDFIGAAWPEKDLSLVQSVLEQVGLDPSQYLNRAVDKTLSGGERKKIELASILGMRPRLVMLDEPDSGIDVASLEKIFEVMETLKNKGTTIILITHSMTVLNQAEQAFLLCCGRLIDQGKVSDIQPYFEDKCIPCEHPNQPELNGRK